MIVTESFYELSLRIVAAWLPPLLFFTLALPRHDWYPSIASRGQGEVFIGISESGPEKNFCMEHWSLGNFRVAFASCVL
ncbi:hypothetical protein F4776DRAFT_376496 [Hypoxylon sp. NC0597]|nr:hypothetical protein F4776DRAFT_376496 [Hypoxylon sp. NC0597]